MNTKKENFFALVTVLAVLLLFAPQPAHAQVLTTLKLIYQAVSNYTTAVTGFTGGIIAWIIFVLNYIIGTIGGIAISILTSFISIILQLNTNIVNSLPVKLGFPVALSLANLGFVLGIIVIAIMTILRREEYGMKQILWKLVVMAVLVNFGLVIAGTVLGFFDSITTYFITGIQNPPTTGTIALNPWDNFASALAGAFNPQQNLFSAALDASPLADRQKILQGAGATFGSSLSLLVALFFPTLMVIAAVIVLVTFLVMLVIRYVYLGLLLILLPLAWVSWVFPALKEHWNKWWHNFLKWATFPPIVVFFLWIALVTAGKMTEANEAGDPLGFLSGSVFGNKVTPDLSSLAAVVGQFVGGGKDAAAAFIGKLLESVIVLGLTVGGIFMANSMGIKFADAGMRAATGVAKGFGGFVGRRAAQAATAPLRSQVGQRVAAGLQQVGAGRGFFGRLATLPARYLGRGLQAVGVAGGANAVKAARGRQAGMNDDQLANAMTTFTAPEQQAALETLLSHGTLDKVKNLEKYLDEGMFKRYDQGKLYGDLDKAILSDASMRELAALIAQDKNATVADKNNVLGTGANKLVKAEELLAKATENFVRTLTKGDVSKMQLNEVFAKEPKFGATPEEGLVRQRAITEAIALHMPALLPSIIPKLKGVNLQNFSDVYRGQVNKIADVSKREELLKQLTNTVANNTLGFLAEAPAGAPATAPAPPVAKS